MTPEITALRREIAARFVTVHRFCRARPELNRSTVYMVLAGTYGGNRERQAERIRAALEDVPDGREERLFLAIKGAACARCTVPGRCARCDDLFRAQARAAVEVTT